MPLYEYQCEACHPRFERIQKFSDPPIEICPACGGSVRKLISSPAIQFKGSGWYITDYAKKPAGYGAKPAASSEASTSDSKTTSDSKSTSSSTSTSAASSSSGSSTSGSSSSGS